MVREIPCILHHGCSPVTVSHSFEFGDVVHVHGSPHPAVIVNPAPHDPLKPWSGQIWVVFEDRPSFPKRVQPDKVTSL